MSSTFLLLCIHTYTFIREGMILLLELYENIKKYRKMCKMSQERLAQLTGYSDRSSIAKIEKGEVDIPQSKIMLFAKALNVDAGTLMGNDGIEYDLITDDGKLFIDKFHNLSDIHREAVLQYIKFLSSQEHPNDDSQKDS